MNKFREETAKLNAQHDRDDKNNSRIKEKAGQVLLKSKSDNPDCTCHTGKCGCQDK
jgi:hypothetical protein